MVKPTPEELRELRAIATIQFRGVNKDFIPSDILVYRSPSTYRIRMIYLNGKHLLSLRASDYRLILRIHGGIRLNKMLNFPHLRVIVSNKYAQFIREGRNVFAPHIVFADPSIRPGEEVLILDEDYNLVAVGRAILPGWFMTLFKRGEAVRVREGVESVK